MCLLCLYDPVDAAMSELQAVASRVSSTIIWMTKMSTVKREEEPQVKREKREETSMTISTSVDIPTAAAKVEGEKAKERTYAAAMEEKVALLVKEDSRVGWPTTRPPFDTMVHGWFFSSHEEVLLSLLDREKTCKTAELHIHISCLHNIVFVRPNHIISKRIETICGFLINLPFFLMQL